MLSLQHAVVYADPEHAKHAQWVTCPVSMLAMQELGWFQLPLIVYRSLQHGVLHYHAATWGDGRGCIAQKWASGSRHEYWVWVTILGSMSRHLTFTTNTGISLPYQKGAPAVMQCCLITASRRRANAMSCALASLSLRHHVHGMLAKRLMHMAHLSGNTSGVSKSSSDWLNYTGYPGDMCVAFFKVLPGNKDSVMPNPLTKEESHRVYNCDDKRLSGSTKCWIFKSMWNI